MPRANWGVDPGDVDEFDRESQYTPYSGPVPPNAVYQWNIKVLKFITGTRDKFPQLRLGLELVPRAEYDEKRYKGYFLMAFMPVSDKTAFRYVPFLDAIGVSGRDFTSKTITDEEGNIRRIGAWRHDGKTLILAEQKDGNDQNGNPRKEIGWIGAADSTVDDEEEEDYDEEEVEEDTTPPRRSQKATSRSRKSVPDDDWS